MSYQACNWALRQRVGSGYLKATLAAIAVCDRGEPIGLGDLVAETGLSEKTIRRHLKSLSVRGFVLMGRGCVSLNMGGVK